MKILSQLQSPALAGVIREKSTKAAIAEIKNCYHHGATMIDLHLSCLENTDVDTLGEIVRSTRLPILALNYNLTYEWKSAELSEEERVACLLRALDAGAQGVDIQGYTFHTPSKTGFCGDDKYSFTKGNPKEIVTDSAIIDKQCRLIERVHAMDREVLLSCHPGIYMPCEAVVELALFLEKRGADIIKIVTRAENEENLTECIRTMMELKKEVKTPVAFHTYGAAGIPSRIINPLLGGHIVFCVDRFNEASTMEQLDLRTAAAIVENAKRIL